MKDEYVVVGVGVIVEKGGRVLLGRRRIPPGMGSWQFPGGHLDFGESVEECARREAQEEAGVEIDNIRRVAFTTDFFSNEGMHCVTLFVTAQCSGGAVEAREPGKSGEWGWFEWANMPEPLFLPIRNLREQGFKPQWC